MVGTQETKRELVKRRGTCFVSLITLLTAFDSLTDPDGSFSNDEDGGNLKLMDCNPFKCGSI